MYGKSVKEERMLSLWCMTGHVAMHSLVDKNKIRNIILTSGTLSPLDSWTYELQLCVQFISRRFGLMKAKGSFRFDWRIVT